MTRNSLSFLAFAMVVASLTLSGCGTRTTVRTDQWRHAPHAAVVDLPPRAAVDCGAPVRGRAGGTVRLALPGSADPLNAPLPATEAERHLFATLYETLVRVDCDGRLSGGLATAWQAYEEGRVWVLDLREGARFWDGTPVTAGSVAAAWRRAETLCLRRGEPDPFLLFSPAAVEAPAPGQLLIRLQTASEELPLLLAHPALAVVGRPGPGGWLAGTGPATPAPTADPDRLALVARPDHPRLPAWERLDLVLDPAGDPRELLDAGLDALVTRDRAAVAYYRGRGGARPVDLPWDRWYYLVVPPEGPGDDPRDRRRWAAGWNRRELAREVAVAPAEPADFFAYTPRTRACSALPPRVLRRPRVDLDAASIQGQRDDDLVLWPADDPDAHRLAERLAVVAARPLRPADQLPGRGPLTPPVTPAEGVAPVAAAVDPATLAAHVQAARAGAMVVPWPRRTASPCLELARLLSLAGWLRTAGLDPAVDPGAIPPGARAADPADTLDPLRTEAIARRLERGDAVQPLIRTHATVILGGGLGGPAWNHDGSLRLETLGKTGR